GQGCGSSLLPLPGRHVAATRLAGGLLPGGSMAAPVTAGVAVLARRRGDRALFEAVLLGVVLGLLEADLPPELFGVVLLDEGEAVTPVPARVAPPQARVQPVREGRRVVLVQWALGHARVALVVEVDVEVMHDRFERRLGVGTSAAVGVDAAEPHRCVTSSHSSTARIRFRSESGSSMKAKYASSSSHRSFSSSWVMSAPMEPITAAPIRSSPRPW